jgi:hypothetical protein
MIRFRIPLAVRCHAHPFKRVHPATKEDRAMGMGGLACRAAIRFLTSCATLHAATR